jgi:hypothetical protein
MEVSVEIHTLVCIHAGKGQYSTVDGVQSLSGRLGESKHNFSVVQPVA